MTKRPTAAETNRNWLVTVNRVDVSGLITFAGLHNTGQRLTSGLSMTKGVPPIISMPPDKELTIMRHTL